MLFKYEDDTLEVIILVYVDHLVLLCPEFKRVKWAKEDLKNLSR